MSIRLAIADAVTASISGLDLGQPFNAVRKLAPELDQEAIDQLEIRVIPLTTGVDISTRSQDQWVIEYGVHLVKKVGNEGDADALITLVESLMSHFRRRSFTVDGANRAVFEVKQESLLDIDRLDNNNIFDSVFTLGFLVTQ